MEPETWYGYIVENSGKPCSSPAEFFELMNTPPLAMVKQVDLEGFLFFAEQDGNALGVNIGDYVLTFGSCQTGIQTLGPYQDIWSAFTAAQKEFGINKFLERLEM